MANQLHRKAICEIGPDGQAVRIFQNRKASALYEVDHPTAKVKLRFYTEAVGQIRRKVFERDDYSCCHCGEVVRWERGFWNSGELDERKARGLCEVGEDGHYHSGEISVDNCVTLCHRCHTGLNGKHDRSPSFTRNQ
jgi:hypothetical protein